MREDKYFMTSEENVFYAKRNIVDSIWKSANLEGIPITFPETQAIFDGANVAHLRIDEIQTINNLKHAWEVVLFTIGQKINYNYLRSIHACIGANLIEQPGEMRAYEVSMGGTNWKPDLPNMDKINKLIESYYKDLEISQTNAILKLMCKLMKMQIFNDGNKRTAMLIANHELISMGRGIVSVAEENKIEFGQRLIEYYENEEKLEELINFLYEKCLDGKNKLKEER